MKKIITTVMALALTGIAFANPKGNEIMQKVHDVKEPLFNTSAVKMSLYAKGGTLEETRNVMEYGRSNEKDTSVVMDFKTPANYKGTKFLQTKTKADNKEIKYIYMPSLGTTRQVSSADGTKAFLGTDATYDDMSTREMEEDTHEFLREESKVVGPTTYAKCYVIEETPVDPKSSQYSKKIVWIDDASMYPVYSELYDKKGKLLKILSVEKIDNIKGYNVPMKNVLENVQTGHKTTLEVLQCKIDEPIPDNVFTTAFLSRK